MIDLHFDFYLDIDLDMDLDMDLALYSYLIQKWHYAKKQDDEEEDI